MTTYEQIVIKIIKEQELIIGPLAWIEAAKVSGLSIIDKRVGTILVKQEEGKGVIDQLVAQYDRLFGKASHEVCKEAVASIIADLPLSEVPSSLQ